MTGKERVALLSGALLLLSLSGCAGYYEYTMRSLKPNINAASLTQYQSSKYQVLGVVKATGTARCVLGIVLEGDDGQGVLWEEAISKFGNKVTGIKDITSKSKYSAILPPIFGEIETTYYGTAVRE